MRVLFLGTDVLGSNALSMANGARLYGDEVLMADTQDVSNLTGISMQRISRRLRGGITDTARAEFMSRIKRLVREFEPELLFCFKTINIPQRDLLDLDVRYKVHYSADDMSNTDNVSTDYLKYEKYWDLIVTTKKHNILEMKNRGVSDPFFVWSAYDPVWHFPVAQTRSKKFTAGFIGNYRENRAEIVSRLATELGKEFFLAGPGWRRRFPLGTSGVLPRAGMYGPSLSGAISNINANLVFLNSDNRDSHTCRSFEVPAAGGLFVGPRTDEHAEILEDGSECLLYSNDDELMEIIDRIHKDSKGLRAIGRSGSARVCGGKNTYADRWSEIRDRISEIR